MPKGNIIGHITVNDPEAYKEYVTRDTPIIEAQGGRSIVSYGQSEARESEAHTRHVVFEFLSYAAAKALLDDPQYREVAEIRRRTADNVILVVESV